MEEKLKFTLYYVTRIACSKKVRFIIYDAFDQVCKIIGAELFDFSNFRVE
jgi:hypothetical protein